MWQWIYVDIIKKVIFHKNQPAATFFHTTDLIFLNCIFAVGGFILV